MSLLCLIFFLLPFSNVGQYMIGPGKVTWDEANQWCNNQQFELISIHSESEYITIRSFINATNPKLNYWTGLKHDGTPIDINAYTWSDGTSFADASFGSTFGTFPWRQNEPNLYGTPGCVQFTWNYNFLWNDINCSSTLSGHKAFAVCNTLSKSPSTQIPTTQMPTTNFPTTVEPTNIPTTESPTNTPTKSPNTLIPTISLATPSPILMIVISPNIPTYKPTENDQQVGEPLSTTTTVISLHLQKDNSDNLMIYVLIIIIVLISCFAIVFSVLWIKKTSTMKQNQIHPVPVIEPQLQVIPSRSQHTQNQLGVSVNNNNVELVQLGIVNENNSNEDEESSVGHQFYSNYRTVGVSEEDQIPRNKSDEEHQTIEGHENDELLNVNHVTEYH